MAYNNINFSFKKYVAANNALDNISKLKDNWNQNHAKKFSFHLIQKCRAIINELEAEPFVCPTVCGSIQLEYEKPNGSYLEFEIYEDKIEVYMEDSSGSTRENCLNGISAIDKVKQLVVDFYA